MWLSFTARKRREPGDPELTQEPLPRTHAALVAEAARLKAAQLSKTALAEQMRDAGINKLTCALQPHLIRGADSVLDKPPDIMHIFGCGMTRIEPAWALEILFKPGTKWAVDNAWAKLNASIAALHLPRGKRISKLYPQKKDKAWNEMHLDLNAEETMLFMMHSVSLVEPLLTDDGREHQCWKSWLAHRALVAKCLQHSFADCDALLITELIDNHEDKFALVTQYRGLERPKAHFRKHLPDALRRFGPFCGFWCMSWEAFLQERPWSSN